MNRFETLILAVINVAGLEIATNTVAFATEFFYPLRLNYLEKSHFFSPSLFRNIRVSSCHFAATLGKINKAVNFLSI